MTKTIDTNANYISSEDYQKIKSWRNFDESKWRWCEKNGIYVNNFKNK